MKRTSLGILIVLFAAVSVALVVRVTNAPTTDVRKGDASRPTITVYKTPTCGCCANYIAYLRREGYDVSVVEADDLNAIQSRYGIPKDGTSCHTSVMGDYAVEGHVPIAALVQLAASQPSIAGIGLAGMPQGSPGMSGAKRAPFDVYAFTANGATSSFGAF